MKNRFSLVLIISLVSCSNAFGDWSDNAIKVVDGFNYITEHLLSLKTAPVFKEVFHEDGKIGSWHRAPKTIMTAVLAYFTWKNETVRKIADTVAQPVKRALRMKKKQPKKK